MNYFIKSLISISLFFPFNFYLDETDLSSLLSEASSADHHLILGDKTLSSSADSALL